MSIAAGKKLPDFSLPRSDGSTWKTSDYAGTKLVLYFYPKDMTEGCTLEGRDFRDLHPAFRRARTQVLGKVPRQVLFVREVGEVNAAEDEVGDVGVQMKAEHGDRSKAIGCPCEPFDVPIGHAAKDAADGRRQPESPAHEDERGLERRHADEHTRTHVRGKSIWNTEAPSIEVISQQRMPLNVIAGRRGLT